MGMEKKAWNIENKNQNKRYTEKWTEQITSIEMNENQEPNSNIIVQ